MSIRESIERILVVVLTLGWAIIPVSGLDVRLVNGSREYEGNVEIYLNGTWGYICDDDWDKTDATVICRMLGYNTKYSLAYTGRYFPKRKSWLYDVVCSGTEQSIYECSHHISESWNCHSSNMLVVRCGAMITNESSSGTEVRLVGGPTQYEGRVEILYNGTWGTICSASGTANDVVCRMLRYGNGSPPFLYKPTFLMDDVSCTGKESSIDQCQYLGLYSHNCNYQKLAGVRCGVDIRLVDGPNEYEGNVEISLNGTWGYICDDNWNDQDARVICRMLGYNPSYTMAFGQSRFPTRNALLFNVTCSGTEQPIDRCIHNGWGSRRCYACQELWVECESFPGWRITNASSSGNAIRLVGGKGRYEGRVEVLYNGTWGTICDSSGYGVTKVVCRMLGYRFVNAYTPLCDPQRTFLMDNVSCTGVETSIEMCSFPGWYRHNCGDNQVAAVRCGCFAGTYHHGYICRNCTWGQYQHKMDQRSCVDCHVGQYQNQTGQTSCLLCPRGQYQNLPGQSSCFSCPLGQYQNNTGQSSCLLCPKGQFQNLTAQSACSYCDVGLYQNLTGQQSCKVCPAGSYQNITGQSSCSLCPIGTYQTKTGQSACSLCPIGTFQNMTGQSACSLCPVGTYQTKTGQSSCSLCPIGTYQNITGQSACSLCPIGTYQTKIGQSACSLCPIGTYQTKTGQSAYSLCPIGTFQNMTGQSACSLCPVGTYQTKTGQSSCSLCPIGTYQNITGQSACSLCPIGTYQTKTGQSACSLCPIGTYQTKTGQSACSLCPIGTFQNMTGQSACSLCPVGTYQTKTGQSSCSLCPIGTYQNITGQSACSLCPIGTYQTKTGQSACSLCPIGTFQNMTGQSACSLCPVGTYQTKTGQSSCSLCPIGTYQNITGQSACSLCPIGTYQSRSSQSMCVRCYHGTYQNILGQPYCYHCGPGTYQNATGESSCDLCPIGFFQNLSGQISCTPCQKGSFSNKTGATMCNPCEAGTYQGSSAQTACLICRRNKTTRSEGSESESACYTADVSPPISYGFIGGLAGTGFIIIVVVSLTAYLCYRWYKARTPAYEGIHRPPLSDNTTTDDAQLYNVLEPCKSDQPVKGGNKSDSTNQGSTCLPIEMELIYVNTRIDNELCSDISK